MKMRYKISDMKNNNPKYTNPPFGEKYNIFHVRRLGGFLLEGV